MSAAAATPTTGKQLVRSRSGLRMVHQPGQPPSPLSLDEPEWQSDRECPACVLCGARFDLINRRHHCRRCGVCACAACCAHVLELPRLGFVDPVRHCAGCAAVTAAEAAFYGRQLRLLSAGCGFEAVGRGRLTEAGVGVGVVCRLSPDQRQLQFDTPYGGTPRHGLEPVQLLEIENCEVMHAVDDDVSSLPCGIRLRYNLITGGPAKNPIDLQLVSRRHDTKRHTVAWIAALQAAMKLVADYKFKTRIES